MSTVVSPLFVQLSVQAQIKENIKKSASLAFMWGIHRSPVNSTHKRPVTRKVFPFYDVIMQFLLTFPRRLNIKNQNGKKRPYIVYWISPFSLMTVIYTTVIKVQIMIVYSISQEICTRFLLCCALLWLYIDWFSHIHQAYFTGTVAI